MYCIDCIHYSNCDELDSDTEVFDCPNKEVKEDV